MVIFVMYNIFLVEVFLYKSYYKGKRFYFLNVLATHDASLIWLINLKCIDTSLLKCLVSLRYIFK